MRLSFLLLVALPGIVTAQTLSYRRLEELGPAIPDGVSTVQTLTNSGWALIRSEAHNLAGPARVGPQFYFRSPEGTLVRLPIERAGLDPRLLLIGKMAEDASFALLGGPAAPLVRIDREGLAIRVYREDLRGHPPKAIYGNTAYLDGYPTTFSRYDLVSEVETIYPPVVESGYRTPLRVTLDGKAVYEKDGTYIVRNLANGLLRTWAAPPSEKRILDSSGRYVWQGDSGRLVRYTLATDDEVGYGVALPANAQPLQATDRFVFFSTVTALTPVDDNATTDVYVFDRQSGTLTLATDRQGSMRAAGEVDSLAISPNGTRLSFGTPSPGVSDLASNGLSQLYLRSTARRDTKAALTAQRPGGGEATGGVLSRGGRAALWVRFAAGIWSLRLLTEGGATRTVALPGSARPLDVTDDGRTAMWTTAGGSRLYSLHDGTVRELPLTGGFVFTGHLDLKTRTPLATINRDESADLVRFDPGTGAATVLAIFEDEEFDVEAGRVAWSQGNGVRIVDLTTGDSMTLSPEAGFATGTPGLTADGFSIGIPNLRNGQGVKTRMHRLSDGAFRKTLPFGRILPDPNWLRDDTTGELVYAPTGARLPYRLDDNVAVQGNPVGPESLTFRSTRRVGTASLGDLWRYRTVAPSLPLTESFSAVPRPGGKLDLRATVRSAGLENADTWVEVRIDGTGTWRRLKRDAITTLSLASGPHSLEARGADALGRYEERPRMITVSIF
ncbi:hypothetical protein EON81_06205 [bacterium]|nr:MAG: hypothetical protein EON81_06205 [bacterium]